jgi:cytochrome c peroxidase
VLSDKEQLGKSIFFDEDVSINGNQSCATCHAPQAGWTGPDTSINAHGGVYEGSIPGRFGDRKPPSSAYATQSPVFYQDKKGLFRGGNFWDGRATGWKLGNPAADQAQGPFLNPMEQALPDIACVVYRVCNGDYPVKLTDVWGDESCDIAWPSDVETACAMEGGWVSLSDQDRANSNMAYDVIALSIAAYEASPEVNAFSSKFDYVKEGLAKLSKEEQRGFALFRGKGMCHRCHASNDLDPLFTDYTFDNLGLPKNPENPVYNPDPEFVDTGLGGFLRASGYAEAVYAAEWGKHKVPTLRNVDKRPYPEFVKAFGHNGYFKSLEEITHFYNTRDVATENWPPPEVPENMNTDELGDLGLTADEEAAIVEFMKTLTDGYTP